MSKKLLSLLLALTITCSLPTTIPADEVTSAENAGAIAEAPIDDATAIVTDTIDVTSYSLGDHVDDFTVELCDGTDFNLNQALETYDVVMLNIWATWCNPCRQEFPVMDAAYEDYKDRVAVVALSPYDDNQAIADFKEELGLTNISMGADTIDANNFVTEGYPTTVIIDRFGNFVYYECGSILDEGGFTRMWDCFLGDDYTESTVLDEIPGPVFEGEYPDDTTLSSVLSPDGSVNFTSKKDDVDVWPFLPTASGVSNSNSNVNSSSASVYAAFKAEAGQVFAFDYTIDTEVACDVLYLYINDELITGFSGKTEATYAYRFEEAGDYTIQLKYFKDEYTADDETISDTVELSNASLLSGDAADAAIASMPQYPQTLSGSDYSIEFLNENAKEIVVTDPTNTYTEALNSIRMYVVPDDTASVRICIGDQIDPNLALAYGDDDYVYHLLALTDTDDQGFVFDTSLSSIEDGSYSSTYLTLYTSLITGDSETVYVFKNEENVNYFIHQELIGEDAEPIDGISWEYADGTQPSTDADAKMPGTFTYNVYLQDENGDPVDGVMINVCDDETCQPQNTTDGYYGFDGDPYAYVIHVLTVPEGYSFDTSQEFVFDAEGGDIVITIPHA